MRYLLILVNCVRRTIRSFLLHNSISSFHRTFLKYHRHETLTFEDSEKQFQWPHNVRMWMFHAFMLLWCTNRLHERLFLFQYHCVDVPQNVYPLTSEENEKSISLKNISVHCGCFIIVNCLLIVFKQCIFGTMKVSRIYHRVNGRIGEKYVRQILSIFQVLSIPCNSDYAFSCVKHLVLILNKTWHWQSHQIYQYCIASNQTNTNQTQTWGLCHNCC